MSGCIDCGTPLSYFEDKTVTVPITINDNTILVQVDAHVCPNCGYYTTNAANTEKLEAARDKLVTGDTRNLVVVGAVFKDG